MHKLKNEYALKNGYIFITGMSGRKVIWDELLARTASGKSEEEAVAELELLRAGRSLNRLVDELKQRRWRGQGQGRIRVQVGTPVPDDPDPGPRPTRDQGRLGTKADSGPGPSGALGSAREEADRPSSTVSWPSVLAAKPGPPAAAHANISAPARLYSVALEPNGPPERSSPPALELHRFGS
ncbi:hypothetical protein FOMA001_g18646 [Fusarium oxysporum f. sp. matthiolae]|nr:hypothetical protein FOMA001_g18646 [Fusarium oxysporum f. sp. matthiolae]